MAYFFVDPGKSHFHAEFAGARQLRAVPVRETGKIHGYGPILATALILSVSYVSMAHAQQAQARLNRIEQQILSLKAQLRVLKERAAARDKLVKSAEQQSALHPSAPLQIMPQIPPGYALIAERPGSVQGSVVLEEAAPSMSTVKMGHFEIGAIDIQLGGFFAGEAVYRSRNDVNDLQTNFIAGIPLRNQPTYYEPQTVLSARQTRFTSLATANPDETTRLQAYVSVDMDGGLPTSNYNESNSWGARLREAFLSYARSDWGFELLAGQSWSLLTPTRVGMEPLNVNPPSIIYATSMPGFDYARQAEIRVEKSFLNKQYWLGLSVENPQTVTADTAIPASLGTLNIANPGIGVDATGGNDSVNFAPDVIVKAVADYKLAHLEAFGLGRSFTDRISQVGSGQNKTVFGGGGGGGLLVRLIPDLLEFDASGMAGKGIGRYGAVQLPDVTVGSQGEPAPLTEYMVMAGFVGHPVPAADLYAYAGTDQTSARYFDTVVKGKVTAYGYGNPLYSNAGCDVLNSPLSCAGNTSGVSIATLGGWYRFIHGQYGTVQAGLQYAYLRRNVFQGLGPTPETNDNMVFASFRWFPFQ